MIPSPCATGSAPPLSAQARSGGGAILTDDERLANQAKHLTTTAKRPHRWEYIHDEIGYNDRMPNLNAALGCAQLEQLPQFLASKRRLALRYRDAFASLPEVRLLQEPPGCESNDWLQTLMHQLPPYQHCPRAPLPVAESLARRIINLPSSAGLAMDRGHSLPRPWRGSERRVHSDVRSHSSARGATMRNLALTLARNLEIVERERGPFKVKCLVCKEPDDLFWDLMGATLK